MAYDREEELRHSKKTAASEGIVVRTIQCGDEQTDTSISENNLKIPAKSLPNLSLYGPRSERIVRTRNKPQVETDLQLRRRALLTHSMQQLPLSTTAQPILTEESPRGREVRRRMSNVGETKKKKKKKKVLRRTLSQPSFNSWEVRLGSDLEQTKQDNLMTDTIKRYSVRVTQQLHKKKESELPQESASESEIQSLNVVANLSSHEVSYKIANGKIVITSATVNAILAYVVGMGINLVDTNFVRDFLVTYRYYITPKELLDRIISMHELPTHF